MDSLSKWTNVVLKKICKVEKAKITFSESFSMQQKGGVKCEILLGNEFRFSYIAEHAEFHFIVPFSTP